VATQDHPRGGDAPGAVRTRFRRGGDYLAVAAVVVVTLVVAGVVWLNSDVRATTAQTGPSGVRAPAAPVEVPARLAEAWRVPSGATPRPVALGPTVVSADGGAVVGRDPLTGAQRWRSARDLPLCTVASSWSKVLAVYRRTSTELPPSARYHSGNCSEVTALDATTGARKEQRNGNAELGTRLVTEGSYVTATGRRLLNTWRSDLVQSSEYGSVPDARNPNRQPRPNCLHGSVVTGANDVGVVERCPGEQADRLTVYAASNPNEDEADRPAVRYSTLLPGRDARVVAMTANSVAMALPDPGRLLVYSTSESKQLASYPLDLPATDLHGDPAGGAVPIEWGASAVYWYTGSSTIALSSADLRPVWTVQGALGPCADLAERTLAPVPGGLAVLDRASGRLLRTIKVDRGDYRGTVEMASLGPVVLEQRGDTLVALRAA
jgi:hypothetical protein